MIIWPFQTRKLEQDLKGELRMFPFSILDLNGYSFEGHYEISKWAGITPKPKFIPDL